MKLDPNEGRILEGLSRLEGRSDADTLARKVGMRLGKTMALVQSLLERGLVDVSKHKWVLASLTAEGLSYVRLGLPERRLWNALQELGGEAPLVDCLRKASLGRDEGRIAIGWILRKGWAKMADSEGVSVLVTKGKAEQGTDERLLTMLGEGAREVEGLPRDLRGVVSDLRRRRLIETRGVTRVEISLSGRGVELIQRGIPAIEETTVLTPEMIKTGRWRQVRLKGYDVAIPPPRIHPGKKHPYLEYLERVRRILLDMGFEEASGPYVETEFWNFDALFQAQDHPAREIHSSYRLEYPKEGRLPPERIVKRVKLSHEKGGTTGSRGWGYSWSFDVARSLVLRTQGTAISARYMAGYTGEAPAKMFALARVFRPEALDSTHSMEFYHCEGIVIEESVNFKHLLGFLKTFAQLLGFKEVRFRPSYFPFTEPSVESMVHHPKIGWMEILGGGIFRPEVTAPFNVKCPVLAWGIGIGRLAMASLGIDDIRELFSRDLEALRGS